MKSSIRLATLLVAFSTTTLAAGKPPAAPIPRATPESVGLSSARLQRLDERMEASIRDGHAAGGVVVIARHGRLAYEKAYGESDIGSHQPMRTDQYFRLYSMTKPITAVALLTLLEQGKFQLTDPLAKYVPEFRDVKVYAGEDADGKPMPHRNGRSRSRMCSAIRQASSTAYSATRGSIRPTGPPKSTMTIPHR
jgi:CubicO group peptidase (beta-lactamase class C family)